jgi:WD40 repeat protein
LTGHDDDVVGVDFCSSNFVLATGSDDGTVRLWDTRVWRCLEVLEAPHAGAQVKRVRFSLDGTKLVTAGGDGVAKTFPLRKNADGGVRFLKNGERFSATLRGHADAVFDAAWVPNRGGRLIVTAGHDAAWRVWDLEEGGYP